jgi:hypothetical protein
MAKTNVPQVAHSEPTNLGYVDVHGVWSVGTLESNVKSLLEL